MEKIFKILCMRLTSNIRCAIKIRKLVKLSCVHYLTRGVIASTRPFNLLTRTFSLPTPALILQLLLLVF